MASDGTPELAAIRCGEAIARLRTLRGWTRTQLLTRLLRELSPSDPYYESVSETWLARLENGRMVKVPRQTVEALHHERERFSRGRRRRGGLAGRGEHVAVGMQQHPGALARGAA